MKFSIAPIANAGQLTNRGSLSNRTSEPPYN